MGEDSTSDGVELTRVRRERDFYKKLLELGGEDALDPFLKEALALIVEVAGARRGYIEIGSDPAAQQQPRWWIARGYSDEEVESIRSSVSRGVIAEAVATGRTIVAASALDDPRFRTRGSVQRSRDRPRMPPRGRALERSGGARRGA